MYKVSFSDFDKIPNSNPVAGEAHASVIVPGIDTLRADFSFIGKDVTSTFIYFDSDFVSSVSISELKEFSDSINNSISANFKQFYHNCLSNVEIVNVDSDTRRLEDQNAHVEFVLGKDTVFETSVSSSIEDLDINVENQIIRTLTKEILKDKPHVVAFCDFMYEQSNSIPKTFYSVDSFPSSSNIGGTGAATAIFDNGLKVDFTFDKDGYIDGSFDDHNQIFPEDIDDMLESLRLDFYDFTRKDAIKGLSFDIVGSSEDGKVYIEGQSGEQLPYAFYIELNIEDLDKEYLSNSAIETDAVHNTEFLTEYDLFMPLIRETFDSYREDIRDLDVKSCDNGIVFSGSFQEPLDAFSFDGIIDKKDVTINGIVKPKISFDQLKIAISKENLLKDCKSNQFKDNKQH